MIGPLPPFHRVLVALTVLTVAVSSGMWITRFASTPAAVVAGAFWGAIAGALLTFALLHDFHRRPVRVRARSRRR